MSKIIGNANVIKIAKEAKAGDNTVLINWDAIADLPDEYEAVVTEVKFNITEDFSDVGNSTFMPSPAMHYKIAEARGIHGGEKSITEPIYEDININEMNMIEVPAFVKMLVGYRSVKYSTVLEEDGTLRRSSACSIDYNVWNRCTEAWATEEKFTEGYSKKGKYDNKYDSKWKRKSHFQTELKFAMQKAETKAHEKTIRELAGLQTGYKKDQLSSGRLIFAKIRRSRQILQAESAARLTALSKGLNSNVIENQALLFGAPEEEESIIILSAKDKMIAALEKYGLANVIPEPLIETADNIIKWLEKTENPETTAFWSKAIAVLKAIEEEVAPEFKYEHGLT